NRSLSLPGDTALKALADHLLGQFAADEDDAAFASFAFLPGSLMITFQHHVNALEDITVVIVAEGKDSFGTQDVLAFAGNQVLQPRHEFGRIERPFGSQRKRLHFLVVVVFQAAVVVIVMMIVAVMVVVIMMVVAIAGFQKFRLDLQDAIEIERAALQNI